MAITTIPLDSKTRDKLRSFANKSESWNDLLNRLYDNAVTVQNAQVFFSSKTMDADELIRKIENW